MTPWMLEPGEVVVGRFEIESQVRKGDAEMVLRAWDRQRGSRVALRVLRPAGPDAEGAHFVREAEALGSLRHPGLVAYVAHGQTERHELFLATEWLEGESLAERLERRPLRVGESLVLGRRVGEALAVLHGRGLSHRGITPGKLFLREGRIELVTVLDFGTRWGDLGARTLTGSTEILAALRYLAPEQARGEAQLGPGVDVYALGCVLFQCLTGRMPFAGGPVTAMLKQILYKEAPRLGQLRPELPAALEALLGRMLAKQPRARLADGAALVAALEGLEGLEVTPAQLELVPNAAPALARVEAQQHPICLIVTRAPRLSGPASDVGDAEVQGAREAEVTGGYAEIEHLLESYDPEIEIRPEGTVLVRLEHAEPAVAPAYWTATDQAAHAAHAAHALEVHLPTWPMALVTELGPPGARLPPAAIERALKLLGRGRWRGVGGTDSPGGLWLDELTARLLDTRFRVRAVDAGAGAFVLERERAGLDEVRPLLGQSTPYVGRSQELQLLEAFFRGGMTAEEARVALVLAEPGMGKSRLRHELARRLTEHGGAFEAGRRAGGAGGAGQGAEVRPEAVPELMMGRGDPLRAGTAGGVLADALLALCSVREGEDLGARQRRFAARVGRHLGRAEGRDAIEFLGELCGLSFSDQSSPQLRAARQDPRLMSDRMSAALISFLRAECAAQPVLLVLEDLHWSDAATVRMIDEALVALAEQPLLVLALGRPELKGQFPRLWERHPLHEMQLGALSHDSGERLVREVLGARATPEVCARVVEQAGGNPLFLEELIRAVAEGVHEPSAALLAMLQARFQRLEAGARRLLGAASVFGEVFWRGGLLELMGEGLRGAEPEHQHEQEIDRWLGILAAAEIVVRHDGGHSRWRCRYVGETELVFRHRLLRDAAYGLLTAEDRRVGHRLAAAYLERMGEREPMILAEHHELGGQGERAARWLARAMAAALEASDYDGALRAGERAVACGAAGEVLGMLRAGEAWTHMWRWNFPAAQAAGQAALGLVSPGSVEWYRALGPVLTVAGSFLQYESLRAHVRLLAETAPGPGAESASVEPNLMALVQVGAFGLREPATTLLRRTEAVCAQLGESEARAQGILRMACCMNWLTLDGDPWPARGAAEEGGACFAVAGDLRYQCAIRGLGGLARTLLGDHEAALAELETSLGALERLQERAVQGAVRSYQALTLAELGTAEALGQAHAMATELLAFTPPSFWCALLYVVLVRAQLAWGATVQAEEVARQATERLVQLPPSKLVACTLWSQALLALGRAEEACARAEEGLTLLSVLGGKCFYDTALRLVAAEAYRAARDPVAARSQLDAARRGIEARAAQIPDARERERFLHQVPSHTRVLELERLWS